ncbi:hypothetical protein Cgig2_021084 [Carnegiea gigantea]|uniref:Uncharacterized protein n=1 Tax=Carnegiea gigantea TaxID=171969 RepID=A0A9Q1GII6_9CARY|nr:hypothetical protein Cgig2_021084 [Carnegiea gigantea]
MGCTHGHCPEYVLSLGCVLGDFNTVLYPGDRIGGTDIHAHKVRPFADCLTACDLTEMRCRGPYYTWTNKTVWSRIDRVFINPYWCEPFGYSQVSYKANVLSNHTAMVIEPPTCPKQARGFQFFIDLIKQQSKADWVSYDDDCTAYFFAKAKQRKLETYLYEIQDEQGGHTQWQLAISGCKDRRNFRGEQGCLGKNYATKALLYLMASAASKIASEEQANKIQSPSDRSDMCTL